jgi:hypothetical protein
MGGCSNKGGAVQDLALPLGMSFAAVLAQVRWFSWFLCFFARRPKDSIFTLVPLCLFLPRVGTY